MWTPAKDAKLTDLWVDGLSCTAIGERLGVSKNAVVGRRNRLCLAERDSPIKRRDGYVPRPKSDRAVTPRHEPPRDDPKPEPPPRRTVNPAPARQRPADRYCAWITRETGRPSLEMYCNQPVRDARCSYCAEHAARAFVKCAA